MNLGLDRVLDAAERLAEMRQDLGETANGLDGLGDGDGPSTRLPAYYLLGALLDKVDRGLADGPAESTASEGKPSTRCLLRFGFDVEQGTWTDNLADCLEDLRQRAGTRTLDGETETDLLALCLAALALEPDEAARGEVLTFSSSITRRSPNG